ncbi:hypothetical protein [Lacrimispora indolis]|uniref:hypothetical protein n=1 Tax=Lacrimispora indolis TaxID=69825 RepID=UPI0004150258|nr:hypothetical protein [[Clostridium] methoxybenzovorans]
MKNIGRYLLIFITILMVGTTLSGCMTITQEDYLREAEKYMKKKYGEKFKAIEYGMDYSLYISPVSHPEWKVTVSFPEPKLWNVEFQDNYVAFLLKDELESAIEKTAKEVYEDCKVFCRPMGFPLRPEWNRDTTLEEYCTESVSVLYLIIGGDGSNKEKDITTFLEKNCASDIRMEIMEIVYVSKEQLQELEERGLDRLFREKLYYWRTHVVIREEVTLNFDEIEWRAGDLQLENK